MFKKFNAGKVGLFVAGLAFGTAGIKILTKQINADRAAAEAYVEDEEVTEAAEAQAEEAQAE